MHCCVFWGFFFDTTVSRISDFLAFAQKHLFCFLCRPTKDIFLKSCIIQSYSFFKFTSSKSYHKKKLRFYVQQIFFLFLLLFFLLETYLYKYTFISLSFIYFFYIYDIISELKNICWFICKVPKLQLKCFFLAHFLSLLLFVIENSCLYDHSYLESLVRI